MNRLNNPNIEILTRAVERLGDVSDEFVFLGGCATGLLLTDTAAPPLRMTFDVDAIVQVTTRAAYYQLSEKLRDRGFLEDSREGAPLCRWVAEGVTLDVMPTESHILGFSNRWYGLAAEHAESFRLSSGHEIRLVSAPYFICTKLEAFDGRGNGDYMASHDIEDLVAVLDGRPELIEEVEAAEPELVDEIRRRFTQLSEDRRFLAALPGHLPGDHANQSRIPLLKRKIRLLADI